MTRRLFELQMSNTFWGLFSSESLATLTSHNKVSGSGRIVHDGLCRAGVPSGMFQLGVADEQLPVGIELWAKPATGQSVRFHEPHSI